MSQDFYGKSKWVKTRKHHHCWGCGGSIPPGENAHYNSGVYDGDFGDFYMHEECYQDWQDNCQAGDDIGYGDIDACQAVRDRIKAYIAKQPTHNEDHPSPFPTGVEA
jgi:hypothetical protein